MVALIRDSVFTQLMRAATQRLHNGYTTAASMHATPSGLPLLPKPLVTGMFGA